MKASFLARSGVSCWPRWPPFLAAPAATQAQTTPVPRWEVGKTYVYDFYTEKESQDGQLVKGKYKVYISVISSNEDSTILRWKSGRVYIAIPGLPPLPLDTLDAVLPSKPMAALVRAANASQAATYEFSIGPDGAYRGLANYAEIRAYFEDIMRI